MSEQIISGVLDSGDSDDDVRVVLITGAGRAFCADAGLSGGIAPRASRIQDPMLVSASRRPDHAVDGLGHQRSGLRR